MSKKQKDRSLDNLPACAAEYINLVIKLMRYRRKVREDVRAELAAHFEDALKDCRTDEEREEKAKKLIAEFGDAKLLAVLTRRAKKRCRPLWQTMAVRAFQGFCILVDCLVIYCVYISLGRPNIAVNYTKEWVRLARPVADEALNAAPLYIKAFKLYIESPHLQDEEGSQVVPLEKIIENKPRLSDLNGEQFSTLRRWIQDNSEALQLFTEATRKPYCWWDQGEIEQSFFETKIIYLGEIRILAELICQRAKLKANDKNIKQAFEDLSACYRAGRHLKGPRTIIEQLVGSKIQRLASENALIILSSGRVDRRELRNFQDAFEKVMAGDTFVMNFDAERFLSLDLMQRCYTDNGKGSGHPIPGRINEFNRTFFNVESDGKILDYADSLALALVGANRREVSRIFQRCYSEAQKQAYKTPWQRLNEPRVGGFCEYTEEKLESASFYTRARYWFVDRLMPVSYERLGTIPHETGCEVKALITVLGLLGYQQEKGCYPDGLNQLLEDGYLNELPMDPYSDKPLIYKRTDGGFTLYSLGPNFIDDGGRMGKEREGKTEMWASNGDVVFWPVAE